ncbi:MAG: 3-hydroxybutyryl-CoA dehydrogenase [Glaciecola sp.]|jgi:3-hydroxybutyryl-CoA dehydrogenase
MGLGIAHVFALFGHEVSLVDVDETLLEKALNTIDKNLTRQVQKERISLKDKEGALQRINTTTDFKKGVSNVKLAVEAATEKESLKLKIFEDLDAFCPVDAILASNTSSISINKIASVTSRADKVIGMHFMNPVPMMQLVEIVKGKLTSQKTVDEIQELSVQLGKIPVVVNDAPGFVANRILMPMINEAIYTLHEGVAGVEEIDTIMKLGMFHPMGPLQLADFIGLDVCLFIINVMHEEFGSAKYAPCPLLVEMVAQDSLGAKTKKGFYNWSEGAKNLKVSDNFTA